jgi:hypothetical protein
LLLGACASLLGSLHYVPSTHSCTYTVATVCVHAHARTHARTHAAVGMWHQQRGEESGRRQRGARAPLPNHLIHALQQAQLRPARTCSALHPRPHTRARTRARAGGAAGAACRKAAEELLWERLAVKLDGFQRKPSPHCSIPHCLLRAACCPPLGAGGRARCTCESEEEE